MFKSIPLSLGFRSRFSSLIRIALVPLFFALFLVADAAAQMPGITVGSASGAPGTQTSISVTLAPGATPVSTLQFDLSFPSTLSFAGVATGTAAAAAGKDASGNAITGGARFLIFGMNQNAIGSGVIASIQLNISAGASAGTIPLTISGIVSSDPDANEVPTTGTSGSVTVTTGSDITPPTISGVSASGISGTSATISWTTNEASDSQVDYGITESYGNTTPLNSSMVTSHSQALSGLTQGTLYYYRVKSRDAAGNLATSSGYTFTTTSAPDTTPPTISGVSATNISSTSATVTWTTNETSDSQVEYGTTESFGDTTPLNSSMVISHSQALSGLTADTLYYYRVMSRDAAGNLATSSTYSFTTASGSDTTPPTISGISSTGIYSTGATIIWYTNENADSQVEYGTSTSYGQVTTIGSLATAHSQQITGLSENTLYHYRVKSRDAAGNRATSGDRIFRTTEAGVPPEISAITVSNITNKSATISWSTNKPADSEIEYWIEEPLTQVTALRTLITEHSLALNYLQKDTVYHFLVKSTDGDGNQTAASELTFTTAQNGTPTLTYPRFSSGADFLGINTIFGMGIANLSPESATLTFTATDDDGNLTTGEDVTNPVTTLLDPAAQLPILDWELFGSGILGSLSSGWGMLESTTADTAGFYLVFDSGLNFMDGGNFSDTKLTDFAFTAIQTDGYNKINIINNNPESANITLDLVSAAGTVKNSQSRMISAYGSLTADLFNDLFVGIAPVASDFVRVHSDMGVESFQVMRQDSGDIAMLPGMDLTTGSTTLYSPQYATGAPWRTTLSIVNLDSEVGMLMFRLVGEDGTQIGATRAVLIPANGKLYIDDPAFFLTSGPGVVTTGYVEIVSDGVRLAGNTVFGDINRETFYSALGLISKLQTSILFSHVASNDMYYHGIAIVNPNATDTVVTLELYNEEGTLLRRKNEFIGAKKRQARVLTQYFAMLEGQSQTSGFVRLTSSKPIASFSLFGTKTFSVLSAIPPQIIQ